MGPSEREPTMPMPCAERLPLFASAKAPQCDSLTGLARIEALSDWIKETSRPLALIVIDVDALKALNARHGYAAGDVVLRSVASRLARAAHPRGRAVRLEADRFALLAQDVSEPDMALRMAEDLCAQVSRPCRRGGVALPVSVTAGVALRPLHATTLNGLIANAERALEAAKERHVPSRLFETSWRTDPAGDALAAGELDRAFRLDEWRLHYQPQVREPGRTLDGVEGLLRWQHPDRGRHPA